MGLLLKLHLSSYITRNTQVLALLQMLLCYLCYCDERCHANLCNDYAASVYVNGKCKHKHIRPFYMFRYTSQFCRLTEFLV